MTTLYTIGHSRHAFRHFADLLAQNRIRTLADVRSRPYSKWAPHFQKNRLSGSLDTEGVDYVFLGALLGGRPDDPAFYDRHGKVDYALRAEAADFLEGIRQLEALAARKSTALMCAEEDPRRCHRRGLITPVLLAHGIRVVHIRGDGRLEPEEEMAEPQMDLFR